MPLASVRVDEGYYRNDYPDADTDEWSSNEGGERFLTSFLLHSAFACGLVPLGFVILMWKLQIHRWL